MSRESVLIVDDDVDIREILAEALVQEGFDVTTASDGLEGLRLLRSLRVRPSVILLDLMMPILDGYGFLEQLRRDPSLASIPLAVVTAGHGIDRDRLGDSLEIIPKPFDFPRLLGVIRSLGAEGGTSA